MDAKGQQVDMSKKNFWQNLKQNQFPILNSKLHVITNLH